MKNFYSKTYKAMAAMLLMLLCSFSLHADYYITGNGSATNNWCCGQNWSVDGCQMSGTPATYSATVPAGHYEFLVTEGNWNDSYGVDNVDAQNSTPGYEGTDNVIFTVASQANISVTFNGTSIVLTSDVPFVVPTVSDIEITGDLLVGNELTFSATVAGFNDDPEIIYSVEAPGSYYSTLSGNTYTPINPGKYKVKADATTYSQSAEKEVTFTVTVPRIERGDLKDSVDVIVPNSDYSFEKYDHRFIFSGYNADSSIYAIIRIKADSLQAGTYSDSLVYMTSTVVVIGESPVQTPYNNGLGDAIVTIISDDSTTYYNLEFDFVGRDSVLYKLDMTYTIPYESTYHETTIDPVALDTINIQYGIVRANFEDALYRYSLEFYTFIWNDSIIPVNNYVYFYVYDFADTLKQNALYTGYSGWFSLTPQNTLYNLTGEILCIGNKKFYINCKRPEPPTAVEDVTNDVTVDADKVEKVFIEGRFYIIRNGIMYDANGRIVRRN